MILESAAVLQGIISLGGLVIPPAFDFIKKKFIKSEADTPERTMGNLAATKPEVLPEYIKALTGLNEAGIKDFNKDVIGTPSQWIVDLRAAIRPLTVTFALGHIIVTHLFGLNLPSEVLAFYNLNISSWFGAKLNKD